MNKLVCVTIAAGARKRLQAALDKLDPKSGKIAPAGGEKKADRKAKKQRARKKLGTPGT